MFLPETEANDAAIVLERVRCNIQNLEILHAGNVLKITVTIGIAVFDPQFSIDECVRQADEALYRGKRTGKNRIEISEN